MSTLRQLICKELKRIRKNERLLQKQVAPLAGITCSHLSHIENGQKNITLDLVEKLADAMGYSITFKLTKK